MGVESTLYPEDFTARFRTCKIAISMLRDESQDPHPTLARHDEAEILSFLNRLTEAVLGEADPEQIIKTTERMLGEQMKVSRVLVAEASEDGETVSVPHVWSVAGMPRLELTHRLADYGERLLADYRAGRLHIRRDATRENPPGPELEALKAIKALAAIDVPVLIDGRFKALVVVHQSTPRDWTEREIALVRQVADRTAAEIQRARALRDAQASESQFRQMADSMPQIVWASRPDGVVDWYNRRWYDYTGLSEGLIGEESWRPAFVEDDLPLVHSVWGQALRTGEPYTLEIRLRRGSDGMPRWQLARGHPVRDAEENVVRWYGTFTDIHDQKLAAESAREGQLRLASALAVADLATFDWSVQTEEVTMDARCRELFGFPPDGAITAPDVHSRIDPEDLPRVFAAAMTSIETGSRLEVEYTIHPPGRPARRVVSISEVVHGPDGLPERTSGVFADVTERRQAEAEREAFIRTIEAERANLAAVIARAPAFICVLRGREQILDLANDEYYRLIGRWNQTGKRIRDVLPEIEGQGFFEMLDEVYQTGKPFKGTEVPVVVGPEESEDRHRVINFVYQPLLGADGKTSGIFVHGVDVTESVRAREAIAESERRRRLALDAAGVGAFNLDPAKENLRSDEHMRRIFGVAGDALGYEQALDIIHPDDRQHVREQVAATLDPLDSQPYSVDHRVIHPDGSVHWVAVRGGATFEGEGEDRRLVSFDGTVADITPRKQAEEELAFQRHLMELIFRESPAAMALWRGEDMHFEKVNPEYQLWFGDRQLVGLPLLESVPELAGQGFDDILRGVLHTGVAHTGRETLARFSRGGDTPLEDRYFDFTYLQVRDPDGQPWGVYDHAVDVTSRVLARQELEESQKRLREALSERQSLLDAERAARNEAEQAGRMKDEFLATLSHELRTPLNAIVGWTQILQMMPDQPERFVDGLAVIARNAKAQTQIIEDILDMSRIISGKLRLDVQRLDLAALVKAGVDTLQPAADAKGVRLQVIIDPAAAAISGDPHRLHQVLWNLVSNAVKFTPRDGRVQVTLQRVNSQVEVAVMDTGEGIAAEFLPHVFDRFRQADSSTTRNHGGLGLGLAIVKQIVELHGGSVRVQSPGKGEGATFVVSLPLSIIHPDPEESTRPTRVHPGEDVPFGIKGSSSDQLAGISVVAVDDEADAVAFVERLLSGCGARVRTATSAAGALALVQAEPPDVIISDVGMPGEDGHTLIRQIRALGAEAGGKVPAIALTAYARTVDRVRALEAGFQMHLSKPVEPAELIVSVAALAKALK